MRFYPIALSITTLINAVFLAGATEQEESILSPKAQQESHQNRGNHRSNSRLQNSKYDLASKNKHYAARLDKTKLRQRMNNAQHNFLETELGHARTIKDGQKKSNHISRSQKGSPDHIKMRKRIQNANHGFLDTELGHTNTNKDKQKIDHRYAAMSQGLSDVKGPDTALGMKTTVECDPHSTNPEHGMLLCSPLEYCAENNDSKLGGHCATFANTAQPVINHL